VTRVSGTLVVLAGTIVLALSGGPSSLTSAGGGPRGDGAEGSGADALTRASAAALAEIEGGRVTGTEISDEDSYYEVEITLGDGQQVDVQLDASFHVLDSDADVGTTGNAD
jgi:hypothetical protein